MMEPRYAVTLMFEWGGGCLWGCNDATFAEFGVGVIEERLPLTPDTRRRLAELTMWHDTALDWNYPPDPSPWAVEEFKRFEVAAVEILGTIRNELGPDFDVRYQRLG